jgi:CubicO group peptidase (beta-lactamase class C family)
MPRYCVWIVAVVVLAGCGGAHREAVVHGGGPTLTDALARTLDAQFRREVTLAGIAGASAAIVFPDGREWSRAVGAAELEPRVAMTTRTSFHFASVTKMATAALALGLAEQGRLGLDDPIIRWYPAWRGDRAATVRDLLGHTAGTKDPTDAALARLDRRGRPFTVRAYIRAAPRPGPRTRQAEYSDVGFVIAGLVLARAGREPLAQMMRRRVFNLPGGAALALQPNERPHAPLVHNYYYKHVLGDPIDLSDGSGLIPNRGYFGDVFVGSIGLAGDVPSLARWGSALLGGGLLSPSSLRAMTRFHDMSPELANTLQLPARQSYGLGLWSDSLDGHLMWGHPGGGVGGHSELWHLPHDRITIAVSWNDDELDRASAPFLLSLLRTTLASH